MSPPTTETYATYSTSIITSTGAGSGGGDGRSDDSMQGAAGSQHGGADSIQFSIGSPELAQTPVHTSLTQLTNAEQAGQQQMVTLTTATATLTDAVRAGQEQMASLTAAVQQQQFTELTNAVQAGQQQMVTLTTATATLTDAVRAGQEQMTALTAAVQQLTLRLPVVAGEQQTEANATGVAETNDAAETSPSTGEGQPARPTVEAEGASDAAPSALRRGCGLLAACKLC